MDRPEERRIGGMTYIGTQFPPRGFIYQENSIRWKVPQDIAMQGLNAAATALQQARAQNPEAGLNPDFTACLKAIKDYTCERLKKYPELLGKFCGDIPEDLTVETKRKRTRGAKRCASCGR